jgi:hypothetical protein
MAELVSSATGTGIPVEGIVTTKAQYTRIPVWTNKITLDNETSDTVNLASFKTIGVLVDVSSPTEVIVQSSGDLTFWRDVVTIRFTSAGVAGADVMGGGIYYRLKTVKGTTITAEIIGKG